MNRMRNDVGNFRLKRKCCSISGHWLFVLCSFLLLVTYASCKPTTDEALEDFNAAEVPDDVDNVEWHHVKIVNGVVQPEEHPIIFYKEDFVSEDFKPSKRQAGGASHRTRKYKEISRRHRLNHTDVEEYRVVKPEKMYFDVLPQAPVVVADDSVANDSKFDATKIRVEVMSLADDTNVNNVRAAADDSDEEAAANDKQLLSKRPKKYGRRMRRDVAADRTKRNPAIESRYNYNTFGYQGPKHAVKGKNWNGASAPVEVPQPFMEFDNRFGGEDETDVVIWGYQPLGARPSTSPAPPLFRDRRPANSEDRTESLLQEIFRQPQQSAIIPTTSRPVTTTTTARPAETVTISNCIWAINQCCSRNSNQIRYKCFENMGCRGSFWGRNPCDPDLRETLVKYLQDQLTGEN